ncbi:MAG: hypothetical protein JWO56_2115 [Acidobacteria bacterium]|nr:hypothetical protein [Acidobacteriota bacterium]
MADADVLKAIGELECTLLNKLKTKELLDLSLSLFQIVVLVCGGGWAIFRYYADRHERALRPATIAVQPSLIDLGVQGPLRYVKVVISVENRGVRAFVIHSPTTVRAVKLKAMNRHRLVPGEFWDGSFASEAEHAVLRSAEVFGRGFWFEPGERNVRSYVVAFPKNVYDLIEVSSAVRHTKREDDAVHTRWALDSDGTLKAHTIVISSTGQKEEYDRHKHHEVFEHDAITLNEGVSQLSLWQNGDALPGHTRARE